MAGSLRVVVTGAGSGIGRTIAAHFGRLGHSIVAVDLRAEAADDVCRELSEISAAGGHGGAAHTAVACDVGCAEAVGEAMRPALASRPAHVLINNAGLQHLSPLETFDPVRFQQLVNVMLVGAGMVMQAVIPGMRELGFGRIVNIGSIHSVVASPEKSAYVAAKHGLVGLSKVVALETADMDITVNTVCPAYVLTPLVEDQIVQRMAETGLDRAATIEQYFLGPCPKKAFVSCEELAEIAEFLTSASARNITGQAIVVDGGWTIR